MSKRTKRSHKIGGIWVGKIQQVTPSSYAYEIGQAALVDFSPDGSARSPAEHVRIVANKMLEVAFDMERNPEKYVDSFGLFNEAGERCDNLGNKV